MGKARQELDESQAREIRWITVWTGLFVLVFVAVGGCRWMLKLSADRQVESAREEGYPVTPEELDAWYSIPEDAPNAADLYQKAFDARDYCEIPFPPDSPYAPAPEAVAEDEADPPASSTSGAFAFLAPGSGHSTPERRNLCDFVPLVSADTTTELGAKGQAPAEKVLAATAIYLERNRDALAALHEAARLEHCRYPLEFAAGMGSLTLPHVGRLRDSARLLAVEAFHAARNGNGAGVRHAVLAGLKCGESLRDEPVLISHLARIACVAVSLEALEEACGHVTLSSEDLEDLRRVLAQVEMLPGLERALTGERLFAEEFFFSPEAQGMSMSRWESVLFALYRATGVVEWDRMATDRIYRQGLRATKLDYSELFAAVDAITAQIENLPDIYLTAQMCLHIFDSGLEKTAQMDARIRAARSALAVELFRRDQGRLPRDLSELTPGFPEQPLGDPFDENRPLRMITRQEPPVVTIYSLGTDRDDDGGVEELGHRAGGDIAFVLALSQGGNAGSDPAAED
mgnify:CR=1 FL=1